MKLSDINPLISRIVGTLDKEKLPGVIFTIDKETGKYHLACTGKEDMGYIGVALEDLFLSVKEDSEEITMSQRVLVRMIFAALVRSYSEEELNKRLRAWRKSIENNSDFDGI
jgi:hypothetical protein